jgi:hypothetical protein
VAAAAEGAISTVAADAGIRPISNVREADSSLLGVRIMCPHVFKGLGVGISCPAILKVADVAERDSPREE